MTSKDIYYYDADGQRITLRPSLDTLAITYRGEVPIKQLETLIRGDEQLSGFTASHELRDRHIICYKRSATARVPLDTFVARVSRSDLIKHVIPVFYRGSSPVVVTDEFVACFKADISLHSIEQLNEINNVAIVQEFDFAAHTFLLRMSGSLPNGAVDMANRYYESGLVVYAEPNFIKLIARKEPFTPNDPFFSQQWHLSRIRAEDAWGITRGESSVIIAIIDDGVDLDHEDFSNPGKIVPGADFVDGDSDPRPGAGDFHGTSVAGVAVADGNNGVGVTGMAPDCRFMAIRLVGTGQSDVTEAQAFRFATDNGASIISNSWGPVDRGGPEPLPGIVGAAFNHAITSGRGGKGCVILFAAGNGNESISSPATLDGYASDDRVIAVAASNDAGVRSGYSDFGPEITVCAPSDGTSGINKTGIWQPVLGAAFQEDGSTLAIFTTDRTGSPGSNPPPPPFVDPAGTAINYTGTFGGTSSATPLAAGVSALMLSIAPDLTRAQVQYILEATAEKIDDENSDPVGRYQPSGHSQWYGYGQVNAFDAVKGARSSLQEGDFVHRVRVTLRRTSGDRFVSTKILRAIDARQREDETGAIIPIRGGPDGLLRMERAGLSDEVEVDR